MVLESLFESESVVKHPLSALFIGFVLSSVSLWIAFFSFPSSASILTIAFIVIAAVPMIHHVFVMEEEKCVRHRGRQSSFVARNFDLIKIYTWFSIGVVASFALWFMFLPGEETSFCFEENSCIKVPTRGTVFKEQGKALGAISAISGSQPDATGKATQASGSCARGACGNDFWCWFNLIFSNNSSLMLMAVLLSFLFGAGALFLITWNASIVGVLIGQNAVAENHLTFIGLLPHGIPEFAGYFLGAISGGMISVALTRKKSYPREFEIVAKDSFLLLIIALFSLLVGAGIEAFALTCQDVNGLVLSVGYILFMAVLIIRTQFKER